MTEGQPRFRPRLRDAVARYQQGRSIPQPTAQPDPKHEIQGLYQAARVLGVGITKLRTTHARHPSRGKVPARWATQAELWQWWVEATRAEAAAAHMPSQSSPDREAMENLKRTVEQLSARLVAIEHQTARTLSDSALLQCRRAVSLAHVGMRADIYVSEAEADLVCSYLQSRIKASFVYLHDITFTRGGYFKIPEQHGIQAAIQPVYVVHESLRLQDICIFVASVAEAEDMLWQRRKIGLMDIVVHALH